MFELYQEPILISTIIQFFSVLTNFIIWLTLGYLFRLCYIYKYKKNLSHTNIFLFSTLLVILNFFGLNINLIPISIAYLIIAYLSWKWIPIKSFKWINISMTLFCLFITSTYVFFNYKIHYISYVFFSSNDILNYSFTFKPYFLIYHVGDWLGTVTYTISGEEIQHVNEPLQYRIYMFYYVLHTLGLLFWLFIYFDVLKKHRFTPDTAQELLEKHKIIQEIKNKKIHLPLGAIDDIDQVKSMLPNNETIPINNKPLNKTERVLYMNYENLSLKEIQLQKNLLDLKEKMLIIKEKDLELKSVKLDLANHIVFKNLKTIEDLQYFMQIHVFAVWDFMSLLKRLQNDLCSVSVPWMPVKSGNAARLINEIVCGEESDKLPDNKGYASHFELYIKAMKDIKADTSLIENFIHQLNSGINIFDAIKYIPVEAQEFVKYTMTVSIHKNTSEVAGSFFNGREDVIPDMFSKLLSDWSIDKEKAPYFHYYLVRHIELDGDEHGPAGAKLINEITKSDENLIIQMLDCSIDSVKKRIELWNKVNLSLTQRHQNINIK